MTEVKDALGRAVSRRSFIGTTALAGLGVAGAGTLLAGCGGGSGAGPGGGGGEAGNADTGEGGTLTWGNWANPGEATRFRAGHQGLRGEFKTKLTYQIVTGDYNSKLLTQLAGGSAPDAFYVNTEGMAKLIESKNIIDLTEFAGKSESPVKVDDFYPGLLPWCSPRPERASTASRWTATRWSSGSTRPCSTDAGVDQNPGASSSRPGTWNRDALDDLLTKIKATGKRGLVIAGEWAYWLSWMTTFGGKTFDETTRRVFDTDPKCDGDPRLDLRRHQGRDDHLRWLAAQGPGHRRAVLRRPAGHLPDGPLDPAEPEEAEVQVRHRALPVRGRQDDRPGERPRRGHGCERQGQGPGRCPVVDDPVRERRTLSTDRRRGSPAAATRCRRSPASRTSSPRATCRSTPRTSTRWPRSATPSRRPSPASPRWRPTSTPDRQDRQVRR